MRVLFVTQTPEFGGAEKHLIELVRRLDPSIECRILCFSGDYYSEALRDQRNVQVFRAPLIRAKKFRSFVRVFRRYPAEVIVLVKGIFEHYPLSAYLAARLSGAGRVIALEHLIPDPLPPQDVRRGVRGVLRRVVGWRMRYRLARKLQGHLSHVTVCVSEAIRKRLVREYGYPPNRTVTIRNGIDLGHYSEAAACKGSDVAMSVDRDVTTMTIVCAARLSSVKRIDRLLDALAILGRSHAGWRCLLLGAGPLEQELKMLANRMNLSDRVTFVGQVTDVRPYLRAADLFVLSSEKEGLPLALLEAMALGVPAVVTDVGGTSEVVRHGENGLLVKSGEVGELASAISYMLIHGDERKRMGKAARTHMQEHFDIEQSMQQLKKAVLASCAYTPG